MGIDKSGDGAAVDDYDFAIHEAIPIADRECRILGCTTQT
jgi:hypothetical protein